jgi:chromate reductase, NAD(P)H dehydrogenase (quinone)
MVTVISGTNRKNNRTLIFAKRYSEILTSKGVEVRLLSLEILNNISLTEIYDYYSPRIDQIVQDYIRPAKAIVVLVPEYNAGIPGVLKLLIDAVKPSEFVEKRIALVGISSGRSGNIRGIDQLTNIFHYIGADVLPYKLPLARIDELLSENKEEIIDKSTIEALGIQAEKLIKSSIG